MTHPDDQTSVETILSVSILVLDLASDLRWPLTNVGSVIRCAEDEFRGAVVSRTNVRHVGLSLDQDLGRTEITQFEHTCRWVQQQVLRLDVAVTDADRMNVGE